MPTKKKSWRFDTAAADRGSRFFPELLVHVKGHLTGRPFELLKWQDDKIIRPLFGRLRTDDGLRVVKTAYVEMGAKNGKSPIGSGLALQGLIADGEPGAEVFSVAASKGQALIIFNVAADMCEQSPRLARLIASKHLRIYRSKYADRGVIVYKPRKGGPECTYKVISADVALNDGINASRVVFDEVHRQPSRELWDLMKKSGMARRQSLLIGFTTAGVDNPDSLAKQEHDYATQVAKGVIDDPTYLPVLWYNATKADWRSEKTWKRANPGLGTRTQVQDGTAILAIEDFRDRVPKLEESPAELVAFKRLNCGMWLPASATSKDKLVDLAAWDRSAGMVDPHDLTDRPAYIAVDMSATTDLTAAVALFPNEPGTCQQATCRHSTERCYDILAKFWVPEATVTGDGSNWSRAIRTQLRQWIDEGLVTTVPGEVIDDDFVKAGIHEWADQHAIEEIVIDRWQARQLRVDLEDEGFTVWEHNQGTKHMAEPTREFITLVTAARLHHSGHKVLRWMADNAVGRVDADGDIKPDKKRSSGKIDGIVCAVMAISAAGRHDTEPKESGFFVLGGTE